MVSGNVNGGNFSGLVSAPETYGIIGTTTETHREFTRYVGIVILDRQKSTQSHIDEVFRGEGTSTGSVGSLPIVMPNMINAIFKNFPGRNGETIVVSSSLSG